MRKPLEKKEVIIIAGGEIKDQRFSRAVARGGDFLICADGGLRQAAKLRLKPDLLIGDLDSLTRSDLRTSGKKCPVKKYKTDKNYSDTEIAMAWAVRMGSKNIKVLGAFGKRIDHTMANILSAGKYAGKVTLLDEYAELTVKDGSFSISGKRGDPITLLPFFSKVSKLNGNGVKYRICDLTLSPGSRGLSNEMTGKTARISFSKGKLMLIKVRKK